MDKPQTKFWDERKVKSLRRHRTPIKKFWFHDDIFKSTVFDSGSVWIPAAEEYIVKLLEKIGPQIKDEQLLKAKDRLLEEEAAHAFMHTHYNKMLEHEGYDIEHYKHISQPVFNFLDKYCSLKTQAAYCAAIEHLTACASLLAMELGVLETGIDERMRKVWSWHYLEEIDHRVIMFDIYQYFGGGYLRRIVMMALVLITFVRYEIRVRNSLLYQGGHWFDWSVHKSGWNFMWGKPGFRRTMIWAIAKYFNPMFHPSQIKYPKALEKSAHRYPIEKELASYFPQT